MILEWLEKLSYILLDVWARFRSSRKLAFSVWTQSVALGLLGPQDSCREPQSAFVLKAQQQVWERLLSI